MVATRPSAQPFTPAEDAMSSTLLASIFDKWGEIHELPLTVEGVKYRVLYRSLGWMAKARCSSAASVIRQELDPVTGKLEQVAGFRYDVYKAMALKEMVVKAPFPISDQVLAHLPEDVGLQLESIIPDPMSSPVAAEETKKESGA